MPVEVLCESAGARRYVEAVRKDAAALLRASGVDNCELSILIVDDSRMRVLNRDFRNRDRATDVLSFPQFDGIPGRAGAAARNAPPLPLGDVVISLETARRQAAAGGLQTAGRLRALLVHGFLHLLGYDHERSLADARRMFARERALGALLEDSARRRRAPGARRRRVSR